MRLTIALVLIVGSIAITEEMMSLEEVAKFDISKVTCASNFVQVEQQMKQWEDLLSHRVLIKHDIHILEKVLALVESRMTSFLEGGAAHKSILRKLNSLKLPHTKSKLFLAQFKALKEKCKEIDGSDGANARKELCSLLKEYIASLGKCQQQCNNAPITVIKIKGQIKDLEVVRAGCNSNNAGSGIKVVTDEKTIHVDHKGKVTETQHAM